MQSTTSRWLALVTLNVIGLCVLGLYGPIHAQPPSAQGPFANATELQLEMVNQLKSLNGLVKEQNALLKSGNLQVITVPLDNNRPLKNAPARQK